MVWTKLDDGMLDHRKIARLSPLGLALHVTGLMFANRNLTDGIIPAKVIPRLLAWDEIAVYTPSLHNEGERVDGFPVNGWYVFNHEIQPAGIWHDQESAESCPSPKCHQAPRPTEDEYLIHDFLVYQPTRDEVLAEREEKHEAKVRAGKAGAEARWHKDGKQDGKRNGKRNGSAVADGMAEGWHKDGPVPVPVPEPVPEPQDQELNIAQPKSLRGDEAIRPSEDQLYLSKNINETWSPKHGALTPSVIVKFNKAHGLGAVTSALRLLHGFPPDAAVESPYAYLESMLTHDEAGTA